MVANTLEDLVVRMEDVDKAQFLKTVSEFNAAVTRDVPFDPNSKDGRRTVGLDVDKTNWATPLEQPPYEAYSVGCGITFTFGGLKIDRQAACSTSRMRRYAASMPPASWSAALFYFNYPGATGLMSSAVFGRLAGRSAAEDYQGFDLARASATSFRGARVASEPGIQTNTQSRFLDSGSRFARPGMTTENYFFFPVHAGAFGVALTRRASLTCSRTMPVSGKDKPALSVIFDTICMSFSAQVNEIMSHSFSASEAPELI